MRLEEVVGVVGKPPGHDDIDDDNDDDDEVMMMMMMVMMMMIMMVIILMRLVTHRHIQLRQIQGPRRSRGAAGGA